MLFYGSKTWTPPPPPPSPPTKLPGSAHEISITDSCLNFNQVLSNGALNWHLSPYMSHDMTKLTKWVCAKRKLSSDWAFGKYGFRNRGFRRLLKFTIIFDTHRSSSQTGSCYALHINLWNRMIQRALLRLWYIYSYCPAIEDRLTLSCVWFIDRFWILHHDTFFPPIYSII